MSRFAFTLSLVAVLAACTDTTQTPPSQANLDRPVDISFGCYGGLRLTGGSAATVDQQVVVSAQPVQSCNVRSGPRVVTDEMPNPPAPTPPGQEFVEGGVPLPAVNWYAFVLQSAPGTVGMGRFSTVTRETFVGQGIEMLDADPLIPGTNSISVGEDPVAISTDKIGCFQVVANAGSCDLSTLDITSAIGAVTDAVGSRVRVNRLPVTNASGQEILARPIAMAGEAPGGVIGNACPAQPTGVMYIAYPRCHLVAAVDSATGTIVAGIDYSSGSPTITDGNVSCPAECGGGGTFTDGIRPTALDLTFDERSGSNRLVIGAENSASLTVVEVSATGLPTSLRSVALEDTLGTPGDFGVTAVTLGPQIGMGGNDGMINDDVAAGQFQFIYAIATDHSIRVVDINHLDKECDTNVDPRLIDGVTDVEKLSCFPVGDPATPARRANARGPGIRLPGTIHDVVPTSVDIIRSDFTTANEMGVPAPLRLIGYFAAVSGSDGTIYIIDVDDDNQFDFKNQDAPFDVQLPLAIAHHIRDAVPQRTLTNITKEKDENMMDVEVVTCETNGPDPDATTGNAGSVRSVATPSRSVPTGYIAAEKVSGLPSIRQVLCSGDDTQRAVSELGFAAPIPVRDLAYQDLMTLRDETWTLTYEGPLSLDNSDVDIDGPPVRVSQVFIDEQGMHLEDSARPYCAAGVESYDIVQMRGCDATQGDAQCPIGYTCYVHPESQLTTTGACMLADEADRLANACKDYLVSARKYTVGRSSAGELMLLPRRRVLPATPIDGCVDTAQCTALADYTRELASPQHPIDDTTEPNTRKYTCAVDPDRAPIDGPGQTGKRCIETCQVSSECTVGGVCRNGQCFEGVLPPQSCVNAPQRYELRSHDAFTVVGTRTGYIHPMIADPTTDRCVRDPDAHPFEYGRIPLRAPACDPTADPRTGRRPDGTFEPNPCSTTVDQTETTPNYVEGTCTLADPTTVLRTRTAQAIKYRNRGMMFHLIDPTYPGDARCLGDRAGTLTNVPLAFLNYQINWRQTAGLTAVTTAARPSYPIKVVRGPTESIWVVDEGDFISTSITTPSTRGKVFRIESHSLSSVTVLQ